MLGLKRAQVYLEPHQLGWRPLKVSWMNTLPAHITEVRRGPGPSRT